MTSPQLGRRLLALVVIVAAGLTVLLARPSQAQTLLRIDSAGQSRQVTVWLDRPCQTLNGAGSALRISGTGSTHPGALAFSTTSGELLHALVWPGDGSAPFDLPSGCRTARPAGRYLLTVVSAGAVSLSTPLTTTSTPVTAVTAAPARVTSRLLTGGTAASSVRESLPVDGTKGGPAVLVSYERFLAHASSRPEFCLQAATSPCTSSNTMLMTYPGATTTFAGSTLLLASSHRVATFESEAVGSRTAKTDILLTLR